MTIEDFLSRLEGVKGGNGQYLARCPAHDDKRASMSISTGQNGKILLHCHAGCTVPEILDAMGLKETDLFPNRQKPTQERPKVVARYNYTDEQGRLLNQKTRFADKTFSWSHYENGKWWRGRKGDPVLYNLPAVAGAGFLYIVEGEKDVETLKAAGIPAVCGADGAGPGKWLPQYTDALRGKQVAVIQDNDDIGKAFAVETANALHGVAASVRLLDLTRIWPELPEHGDTTDIVEHIKDGAVEIVNLAMHTDEWVPRCEEIKQQINQYVDEDIKPVIACASDVPYEPPRFLIPPYFLKGKGTLIQADPGTGKTAFMCAIAATVSNGQPLLGIPIADPGNVLILSVEDDLPVLRGRIEASGGNLDNCYFMTNAAGMTFNSPEVEQAIKDIEAVMVIFDPFQAFLGASVDMFRANEIRPELAKLFEMCDRNDCACAIIAHMSKGSRDNSAVNRALGSVDIPAAMRSIIQIIRNPDNEEECIAVHIKCSNAPKGRSIAYQIGERGGVTWNGFHPMTEADLYTITKRKEKGVPYENEPLVKVLNQLIADRPGGGFWSYEELKSEGAKISGFPPFSTINDLRAKLESGLARELQENDGLIITCGHKSNGSRGIRIEQYKHPQSYQTKMPQE